VSHSRRHFRDNEILYFKKVEENLNNFATVSFSRRNVPMDLVLFCGEGPRSSNYRRTAALRLIVQPRDEDEEKDDRFLHVSK
jgi:hypothetical protein